MRIISGEFKGRRIAPPKSLKARPTTDFAKENLFNILNNMLEWENLKALDLFAGTGSISFEFVSRGCLPVVSVEKEPINYNFIEKVKKELKTDSPSIYKMDVFKYLMFCKEQFDIIFADPPYDLKFLTDVPRLVIEKDLLKENGIFIMEHSRKNDFSDLPFFKEKRAYGNVNFSIFIKE